jgi:hypothetical protein
MVSVDWAAVVDRSADLVKGYLASGIRPTLRQVHYRLASLQVGGYQNTVNCYKSLSRKLVDARKDDRIPWNGLADHIRKRQWHKLDENIDFKEVLESYIDDLGTDPWENQAKHLVIWIEKDALAELVSDVAKRFYVPVCVGRGYSSWTFIHDNLDILNDPGAIILYLGDHDPSGLDIERSLGKAIEYFRTGVDVAGLFKDFLGGSDILKFGNGCCRRLALTHEQVQAHKLLPNPTKQADSRAGAYVAQYGDQCWELDALDPTVLKALVTQAIDAEIDKEAWTAVESDNQTRRDKALAKLEEIELDLEET